MTFPVDNNRLVDGEYFIFVQFWGDYDVANHGPRLYCNNGTSVTIAIPPPQARNDEFTVTPPGDQGLYVLSNDVVAQGDSVKIVGVTQPGRGSVSIDNDNGVIPYITDNGSFPYDTTFTYTIEDLLGRQSTAMVTVHVDCPMTAADDAYTVQQNQLLSVAAPGFAANDDLCGKSPNLGLMTLPKHGSLSAVLTRPDKRGEFTYQPTAGFVGTDSFDYVYCDGCNPNTSSDAVGTVWITVTSTNGAETTTTLASNANPTLRGKPVTFTATVTGGASPAGTVTFAETSVVQGNTVLCVNAPLQNGNAVCEGNTFSRAGLHNIVATYSGDANNKGSSATLVEKVGDYFFTTTTLTPSPSPASAGQSVTLSFSVAAGNVGIPTSVAPIASAGSTVAGSAANAASVPTGMVSVTDADSGTSCSGALDATGKGSCTIGSFAAGTHHLTASYAPASMDFAASTGAATLVVNAAPTVTHTVTPNLVVTDANGIPNGTMSPNTPQTVNDGATATFTLKPDAGYKVYIAQGGCAGNLAGTTFTTNPVTADCALTVQFVQIAPNATTTTLTATPNPAASGQLVTFTATVTATRGSAGIESIGTASAKAPSAQPQFVSRPPGYVIFSEGGNQLAMVNLTRVSINPEAWSPAVFTTSSLAPGTHTIVATYPGTIYDETYGGSSASVTVTINGQPAGPAVPAPALGRWALLLLAIALGWIVWRRRAQ